MLSTIEAAQRKLSDRVMGRPGVSGTAIGRKRGEDCLLVYLNGQVEEGLLPDQVGGFKVVVENTGMFRRL